MTPDGVWVFGYGSLMWEPGFEHRHAELAHVRGWHRRMSMIATTSYGWTGRPGLAAGLHPGGSVTGVAFLIAHAHADEALAYLERREHSYLKAVVPALLQSGARVRALTYVAHGGNGRFRAEHDDADLVRRLAHGRGRKGHAADYVRKSAAALTAHGVRDSDLHRLLPRITRAGLNRRTLARGRR